MQVKNLDKLIERAVLLECLLAQAEKDEDYEKYCQLAEIYKQLAEICKQATLEWRY